MAVVDGPVHGTVLVWFGVPPALLWRYEGTPCHALRDRSSVRLAVAHDTEMTSRRGTSRMNLYAFWERAETRLSPSAPRGVVEVGKAAVAPERGEHQSLGHKGCSSTTGPLAGPQSGAGPIARGARIRVMKGFFFVVAGGVVDGNGWPRCSECKRTPRLDNR